MMSLVSQQDFSKEAVFLLYEMNHFLELDHMYLNMDDEVASHGVLISILISFLNYWCTD